LMSRLFDVSINTLLGSPRKLFCQCCGMPLEDDNISREPDGSFNEEYCKWCYTDGAFVYGSLEQMVDFMVAHMPPGQWTEDEARTFYTSQLRKLNHWK
ncbi:MAG: zinc ribbon domain-containing protein, partial [Bacillota bacterium]|nr:zinc ribbon domain-containing protein [Bacillota bacterium]